MQDFIDKCGKWFETNVVLADNNKPYTLGFCLVRDSIADAYLYFKQDDEVVALFNINMSIVAKSNISTITIYFQQYENYSIKLISPSLRYCDIIQSQIAICGRISSTFEDKFYVLNMEFLKEIGTVATDVPLSEHLAPLFPVDFDKAGDATWSRRTEFLNRPYYTKTEQSTISFITWNVASQEPPKDGEESQFIFENKAPIICISLEEVEMTVQSAVIGSSSNFEDWHNFFLKGGLKNGYSSLHHTMLGSVYCEVFVSQSIMNQVKLVDVETIRFGANGTLANKSAIFVTFKYLESTISYCGCHLVPHRENLEVRNQQLDTIIEKLQEIGSDYKFISGDLNYRVELTYKECVDLCKENDFVKIREQDELIKSERKVIEGEIEFLPTYRFDKKSTSYDTSKKMRVPSYCDRILALYNENKVQIGSDNFVFETDIIRDTKIHEFIDESCFGVNTGKPNYPPSPVVKSYTSFRDVMISDHRPVNAIFEISVVKIDEDRKAIFTKLKNKRRDELSMLSIPKCSVSKRSFALTSEEEIMLTNISCATAEWSVDMEVVEGVDVSPASGTLAPGESMPIKLTPKGLKEFALVTINIADGNPLFLEILEN